MSRFAPYRPENHFEVQVRDTAYRRGHDESWNARIYQPRGAGPFPALLDVHGGAWNGGHLSDDDLMNLKAVSHNHGVARLPELADRFEDHLSSTTFESSFLDTYGFNAVCSRFK